MAENKKSVLLYCDLIHTVESLSDIEAGLLFKHYLRYVNDLNPQAPDRITQITFEPIKQQLKRDLKKWEGTKEEKSVSGTLGNLKRWNNDLYLKVISKEMQIEDAIVIAKRRKESHTDKKTSLTDENVSHRVAKIAVTDTVTVTDTVKVKEREKILAPNFFYIGTELFKMSVSQYLKIEHEETLNIWKMKNKEVDIEKVFEIIDKDVGKTFGDYNHPLNFFRATARELNSKKPFQKQEVKVVATGNYGPRR